MRKQQQGFTLIEIAIVLVIIGLLLGGVLKGQELITSARVRNLISVQDGVKAAFFGFQDRFRAYAGDYTLATTNITGVSTAACNGGNGNGNGRIVSTENNENILVWEHLSKAGFINGTYVCAAAAADATNPKNPYGVFLDLAYDSVYGLAAITKHNLKSGGQIPVEIIAEVDRKIDDGAPYTGSFQYSTYVGNGTALTAPGATACISAAALTGVWQPTAGNTNCGAASVF